MSNPKWDCEEGQRNNRWYCSRTYTGGRNRQDLNIQVWQPPTNNSIKLNIDASFDVRTGVAGLGVVARDEKGDVKLSAEARMDNIQSPLHAEVMAMLFGVKTAEGTRYWESVC